MAGKMYIKSVILFGVILLMSAKSIAANVSFSESLDRIEIPHNTHYTENTILDAGEYYLRGKAYVDSNVHLVIKWPCTIWAEPGKGAGFVLGPGSILTAEGKPGEPIIIKSEGGTYADYDFFVKADGDNISLRLRYLEISRAARGIYLNGNSSYEIQDCEFWHCYEGVFAHGPMKLILENNHFIDCYLIGADIETFGNLSEYTIKGNIINGYQDFGIWIDGTAYESDASYVEIDDNLIVGSYQYAVVQENGYMDTFGRRNNGYWDNAAITNSNNPIPDILPQYLSADPFVNGRYSYPFYIKQDCPLVNGGSEWIWDSRQIGKFASLTPDVNMKDIGVHYFLPDYSNAGTAPGLTADFDNSLCVDINDLGIFADFWLFDYNDAYAVWYWDYDYSDRVDMGDLDYLLDYWPDSFNFFDFAEFAKYWQREVDQRLWDKRPDLVKDNVIDWQDFAVLGNQWFERAENVYSLEFRLDQEPNFINDVLLVTVENANEDITYYLLLDGQNLGMFLGEDFSIPTYEYQNGSHQIKLVGVTLDNHILLTPATNVEFNNRLHFLTGNQTYKYNQSYHFSGFYEPNNGSTLNFSIKDLDDNIIWTNFSSGSFNFIVPAGVLSSPYNSLAISEVGGDWDDWIKDITKEFDVTSDPNAANARSLLVGVKKGFMGIGDWTYNRRDVWKEYLYACKINNFGPTICLFFNQATRANIKTAMSLPSVKSVMIITDGSRDVGKVHRTSFAAWDGPYFSYLGRNWTGPGNYEPLPEKHERGYSVRDLQSSFHQRNKLYVFIDACKNGPSCMPPEWFEGLNIPEPDDNNYSQAEFDKTSDMANSFDIFRGTLETRLYMGWRGYALKGTAYWMDITHYNNFLQILWEDVHSTNPTKNRFDFAIADAATRNTGNRIPAANFSYVGNTAIYFEQ